MKQVIAMLVAASLGGCMATGSNPAVGEAAGPPDNAAAMICNAGTVQSHVGQSADQAAGAAILKASGARALRWGPPRSAWTMDYRQDRVNVRYDDAMTIVEIICG